MKWFYVICGAIGLLVIGVTLCGGSILNTVKLSCPNGYIQYGRTCEKVVPDLTPQE